MTKIEVSPETTGKEAQRLFDEGLFCAESVVTALAKSLGRESDVAISAATGFCSGMGRTDGTCGAVTGAVMGIGLALGRDVPGRSVQGCYEAVQDLCHRFEAEFQSTNCSELLGCRLGTPGGQKTFRENRLGRKCELFTRRAAEMAASVINGHGTTTQPMKETPS